MPFLAPVTKQKPTPLRKLKIKLKSYTLLILALLLVLAGYAGDQYSLPQKQLITSSITKLISVNNSTQSIQFPGYQYITVNFTFSMPVSDKVNYSILIFDIFTPRIGPTQHYYYPVVNGTATEGTRIEARAAQDITEVYLLNVTSASGKGFNTNITESISSIMLLQQPLWVSYLSIATMVTGALLGVVFITVKATRSESGKWT